MLETLLSGGKPVYPQSGPGTKVLEYGDLDLGFFGEVSSTELFNTQELSEELGVTMGTVIDTYPLWLKFAYQGKFLFIPRQPLKHTVAWNTLYALGLVYGTEDAGPLKEQLPALTTPQFTVVRRDAFSLKVRLMRGDEVNPTTLGHGTYDTAYTQQSEWTQLLYRVSKTMAALMGQKPWASYENAELGFNGFNVCQEHYPDLVNVLQRGTFQPTYTRKYSASSADSSTTWRPVLEIISGDYILAHNKLHYVTQGVLRPLSNPTSMSLGPGNGLLPADGIAYAFDADGPVLLRQYSHTYGAADTVRPLGFVSAQASVLSGLYPSAKNEAQVLSAALLRNYSHAYSITETVRSVSTLNASGIAASAVQATVKNEARVTSSVLLRNFNATYRLTDSVIGLGDVKAKNTDSAALLSCSNFIWVITP